MPKNATLRDYLEDLTKMVTRESTTSTDRLLHSSGSGLASKASIGAHVLHSIPPRPNQKPHGKPYQSTTVSRTAKYDKVPTEDINAFNKAYDANGKKRGRVPKFYKVIPESLNGDEMGIDSRSQMKQNMSQIFSMEEPMKPNKDPFGKADQEDEDGTPARKTASLLPQVLAAVSVSLGSMIVGFVSGYTSPASVSMKNLESEYFPVSEQAVSWIGGIMPLAALLGGILGGPLIDCLGRKRTILHTAIPFVVSSLLIACAVDVAYVLVGRAIAGICVGILTLSLPVYLGETVQPEVRGTLGLLPTALGNTGILISFLAGKYLNWWELAFLGAALPLPFLILMTITPETPRWHFSKGDSEQARKSLQKLRGQSTDVTLEYQEIERTIIANRKEKSASVLHDLFSPSCIKPLLILIGLMFFQQMSGINAVIFYTVTIFKDAGSTIDENLCTIVVGIVNFISTFLATALIDKAGRKILLYISDVSMIVTLGTLGTFFYYKNSGVDVTEYGWLPLVSFVIYVVGFSLGFGPVPWLMMGEILPAKVRGFAASLTTAFNWMCTFIVTKTFTDIIACLGNHGAFWMFGIICLAGGFFVYFFVPETRGKSLEDIERKFTSKKMPIERLNSGSDLKSGPLSA